MKRYTFFISVAFIALFLSLSLASASYYYSGDDWYSYDKFASFPVHSQIDRTDISDRATEEVVFPDQKTSDSIKVTQSASNFDSANYYKLYIGPSSDVITRYDETYYKGRSGRVSDIVSITTTEKKRGAVELITNDIQNRQLITYVYDNAFNQDYDGGSLSRDRESFDRSLFRDDSYWDHYYYEPVFVSDGYGSGYYDWGY